MGSRRLGRCDGGRERNGNRWNGPTQGGPTGRARGVIRAALLQGVLVDTVRGKLPVRADLFAVFL